VIGGRSGVTGYGIDEGLRQKFTAKERDSESGLDYFGARYFSGAQGRFTSTDPVAMTVQRIADPQRINLYAYARNNPLAFIDPTGEIISFANDDAEKKYEEYLAYLNCDPEKYKNELATAKQLFDSEVEYQIGIGNQKEGAEGSTTTDGQKVFLTVSNIGGASGETFSLNSRFGHELEHGRQFDSGEFGFIKDSKGNWVPNPNTYDIGDEVKAWNVQLHLAAPGDFWTNKGGSRQAGLLSQFSNAKTDDERAGVLARTSYPSRNMRMNSNNDFAGSSGYTPGQLVRTENIFLRVHNVFK
jgi:RHS repeat-associated protein